MVEAIRSCRGRISAAILAIVGLMVGGGCTDRTGTPLQNTSSAAAVAPTEHAGGAVPDSASAAAQGTTAGGTVAGQVAGTNAAAGTQAPSATYVPANRISCPLDREVVNSPPGSPEAVIATLYLAALQPDGEPAFALFASQFGKEHNRDWIRKQYWPRVRSHVNKYVTTVNPITFRICREDRKGDEQVKYFIRSYDDAKSDPPITLRNEGGQWVVEFFTP